MNGRKVRLLVGLLAEILSHVERACAIGVLQGRRGRSRNQANRGSRRILVLVETRLFGLLAAKPLMRDDFAAGRNEEADQDWGVSYLSKDTES